MLRILLLINFFLASFGQLHNYEVDKPLSIGYGNNMDIVHKSNAEKYKMPQSLNHGTWNNLLKKHVDAKGNVNYQNFKNDIEVLEEYLEYLANNTPEHHVDINERLAYYINLYNAATIKLILDNYPIQSIKDIDSPWGKKRVRVDGKMLSLGYIEHKILRKMNEPRIHFAINCASFSCPKLLNEAFVATSIPSQLERVTRDFINDKTRNLITKDRLQLSNIFKWYKKDFTHSSSLAEYINAYTNESIESNAKIQFLKYNWNLNENE